MKKEAESEVPQNEQNISSHHFQKQDVERFPCDDCDNNYETKASLRTHKYSHHIYNVQETFRDINSTPKEEQDEVVKESFPCDDCGKTYGTKASLRTHKYKIPGHVKNEKTLISLDTSGEERYCDNSLILGNGLDRSLDITLDRSFDKSVYRTSSILTGRGRTGETLNNPPSKQLVLTGSTCGAMLRPTLRDSPTPARYVGKPSPRELA